MLHHKLNPLALDPQQRLNRLLLSDEAAILRQVVQARQDALACEAVNKAVDSEESNQLLTVAEGKIDEARRYRHFLEVLEELTKQKIHHTIDITTTSKKP